MDKNLLIKRSFLTTWSYKDHKSKERPRDERLLCFVQSHKIRTPSMANRIKLVFIIFDKFRSVSLSNCVPCVVSILAFINI